MRLTKDEALNKIEELKKYVKEVDQKETSKTKLEIKTLGGEVLWSSEKTTIKEALEEAVEEGADLVGADLEGANLEGANLVGADFYHTKFFGRGGTTRIKKDQLDDFLTALGVIVE